MGKQQRTNIVLSLVISGILAGCGGGGNNNNNNPNTPPAMLTGDTFAVTTANRLVSFSSTSPATSTAVTITGLQNGENILAMDLRPGGTPAGQMYALTDQARVYTIDPSSGAATLKATMSADPSDQSMPFSSLAGTSVSIDVNNLVDQLRVVTNTGQNLRVMLDTGATFSDNPMTVSGNPANGITEVGYTNNFAATCRTTVFYLDTTADRLMTSANASGGILTPVGPLTVDATAAAGFDISTTPDGTNTLFAALTVNGTVSLYTINPMTGAATAVGAIGALNQGESILGLARPVPTTTPTQPVGAMIALTDNNGIVSFNTAVPSKTCTTSTISGLQGGETVVGIDTRPSDQNLYALTNGGRLYTVNQATGIATLKSTLTAAANDDNPFVALDNGPLAIDVSPAADGLRIISAAGTNLRVNMDSGATITDTTLNPAGSVVSAIGYTNKFAGTAAATLYGIDSAGDRLVTIGRAPSSPIAGDVLNVGALNIGDVQGIAGMEIDATNNAAFAALQVGAGTTTSNLYSINLQSGAATLAGTIGTGVNVRALAASRAPQATVFGATTDARLVTFNPATPGTLNSNMPITGLQGGENIIGFDLRPADQMIYVLTDGMRVYTLNTTTGMAMLNGTLMPTMNDPFTGLNANAYGIDFSPAADAIRVVTNAEHNLAVLVNGGVITQTPITRVNTENNSPSPDIVANAYNQNYTTQMATRLYNIDMATNALLLQFPAAGGQNATIGTLLTDATTTPAFASNATFDIAGGEDGLSIAALQPSGATQSTLYRVNLLTGAATSVGLIGAANSIQPLVGLTIRLQ